MSANYRADARISGFILLSLLLLILIPYIKSTEAWQSASRRIEETRCKSNPEHCE